MNVGVSVTVPMSVCRYDSLWYQKITPKVLGVGETEKKDFFFFGLSPSVTISVLEEFSSIICDLLTGRRKTINRCVWTNKMDQIE